MGDRNDIINFLRHLRLPQKPHPNILAGLEYDRRLKTKEAEITTNLLNLLPSTYASEGAFPNYGIHLKTIAREVARLQCALDQVADDKCYEVTRSEFLWQIIGYMVFVDGRVPDTMSDVDFRDLLLNIIRIYFQGSTPKSMEELVNLFFDGPETVSVVELFREARLPGSGFDVHDTFKWRVDIGHDTFPSDLFSLESDLRILIRIAKPAHTLYTIRHLFTDMFGDIIDELTQFDLCWYNYDDLRGYCDGWKDTDRLGVKETRSVTDEDHTSSFDTWVPTSNLILKTNRGPLVKAGGGREIADAATDVTVKVNNVAIADVDIVSVNGLTGEIEVASTAWSSGDTISVSYTWAPDPVFEMVLADPDTPETLAYRLNESHTARNGRFLLSSVTSGYEQAQPEQVEWHYKMFERAYTASLNDPTTLVLNAPLHATSFPPFKRTSQIENTVYVANELPQDTVEAPWTQVGSGGTTAVSAGSLFLADTSAAGIEGGGEPLYFFRYVDQTFPNVFSMAIRVQVQSVSALHGVFTGVGFMVTNETKTVLVGLLDDGGTRKIGILKSPGDEELISSWETVDVDWTTEQTYRFNRLENGSVDLFLGGSAVASVSLTASQLPVLSDLDLQTPDRLQGVYFGSFSRKAASSSRWEFVNYFFQPTQFTQSAQQIFSYFEADTVPQEDPLDPYLVVGSHGHERLVSVGSGIDALTVHDVSATLDPSLVAASNLAGGEFHTYFHDEPLYEDLAWATIDWKARVEHATEEVTGVGFIADDGRRQVKVSFLKDESFRLLSYNGQTLPEDDPEADTVQAPGWIYSEVGTPTREVIGHRLVVSYTGGETYEYDARWSASGAVPGIYNQGPYVTAGNDWQLDFRIKISNFIESVTGDGPFSVYLNEAEEPSARNLFLALRTNPGTGTREIALRTYDSGVPGFVDVAVYSFDWFDSAYHDYRVIRNTTDANPANHTVLVFVDETLVLTTSYTSFEPSDNSTGVFNHLIFAPEGSPTEVTYELEYLNLYNFDSDASAGMSIGIEVRQATPTPFYGFQSVVTAFETVAVDWTQFHEYRLIKDPTGFLQLSIDGVLSITVEYKNAFIPVSPSVNNDTLPRRFITWGSFSTSGLSRSTWDYFRYRIFDGSEGILAPHHMFLNQHNVVTSYEHNQTILAHEDAQQPFSSMGVPSDSFLQDPNLTAFTVLNEGTPPVPMTQAVELTSISEPAHAINNPPDDVLNDNPDFLLNDGTQITVIDDTGQGGWDHWGEKSGLYECATFYDQHTGEEGLVSVACDTYGLAELILNFSSACRDFGMDSDPVAEGYTFVGSGGGIYAVDFVSDTVRFQHDLGGSAYFTNQNTPLEISNLVQGENSDVTIEARIKITHYELVRNRDIGFTFFDGVRQIQLTIGQVPDDQLAVVLSGVDGARFVLWSDWTDNDFHTFKLTKRARLQQVELEIDGVPYPTATLPYSVAGTVDGESWEPPYLVWGSGIAQIGPNFVFPPAVLVPTGIPTQVEFDYIEVCTVVGDEYIWPSDMPNGLEQMLVYGGGRAVSYSYSGGAGFATSSNILGGYNTNYLLWGHLGMGHRSEMALDWTEEDLYEAMEESPCVEVSPGVFQGSCMQLCFDYDSLEIGLLNNYPAYPDPAEPGSLLGPGAGIADSTFWLGPLVTPAFPAAPVSPPSAGACTDFALIPNVPTSPATGFGGSGWGDGPWGGS